MRRLGLAGTFVSYISVSLVCLFTAMAAVTLSLQRDGFASLVRMSSDVLKEMTEDDVRASEARQKARMGWLGGFLAAASPEAVYSSDLTLLLGYCALVMGNPEIHYIAFRTKQGNVLAEQGDAAAAPDVESLSFPIKAGTELIGNVQLSYSLALIHEEARVVRERNADRVATMEANAHDASKRSLSAIGTTLIVSAAIVAVIVTLLFRRMVIRRLAVMESSFQAISHGNGDLKSRVRVSGSDEIDRLGIHFNSVLEKLHGSLAQVAAESEQISASSKRLADASSVAADRVSDQESATEQVASAVTKVSAAISAVADSAAKAASIAESVASEGKVGSATLASTIGAIEKLAVDAQSVSQSLARLGANTDQIGGVVGVIRGIAEQTNLLALNAAIEAARAGENGRGFAVVADEVRTLSQRTQQSTQEIHQMIAQLQEGVKGVVQLISSNDVATKQVASQAGEAGSAISSIVENIATIASVSAEIAASTSEQRRAIGDIDRSIVAISQVTTETSASVAASNEAGHSLQKVAEQLSTITRSFNL